MPDVIADTSCLIVLSNLERLDILYELYSIVLITPEVAAEFGEVLPGWIHIRSADPLMTRMLRNDLELGEASAMALVIGTPGSTIILDDRKARRIAEGLGIRLTGTLGVIAKAYRTGLITDIAEVIADLRQSNFRVPRDFERIILGSR